MPPRICRRLRRPLSEGRGHEQPYPVERVHWLLRVPGSPERLTGRTRNRAVGAEHAAVAWLGLQLCSAPGAFIKELTGVGWHGLRLRKSAMRTCDYRFRAHPISSRGEGTLVDMLPSRDLPPNRLT